MLIDDCVNCHNTHKLSPKSDWALGDIAGVLEIEADISKQQVSSTHDDENGYWKDF